MLDILQTAGTLVLLVLGIQYLVGPLIVRATLWYPARFNLSAGAPGYERLPESAQHASWVAELEDLGFELLQQTGVPGSSVALASFLHAPGDGAFAYVASIKSGPKQVEYVEFAHWQAGGRLLVVNNCSELLGLGDYPPRRAVRLPQIQDLAELYGAFRAIFLYEKRAGHAPLRLHPGEITASMDRFLAEEGAYFHSEGYFQPPRDDRHRLTMKGALRMTWRQCFPVKQIINRRECRDAGRLLMRAWGAE